MNRLYLIISVLVFITILFLFYKEFYGKYYFKHRHLEAFVNTTPNIFFDNLPNHTFSKQESPPKQESYPNTRFLPVNKNNLVIFQKLYAKEKENQLLENAIANNPVSEVLLNTNQAKRVNHHFSNKIYPSTEITDQEDTGRCWIFSFLNMFRYKMIGQFSLPSDFQLSQNYLSFFDKLEKCHYFLQNIASTTSDTIDGRTLNWMVSNPLSDGGNWNMLVDLINKYGVVPKTAMPETYQSSHTDSLNMFLINNLKRMAYEIRSGNLQGLSITDYINRQTYFIYKLLVIFLGAPPDTFSWNYKNAKTGKVTFIDQLTPLVFSQKYLNFTSSDWVVCGNFPLPSYPFYHKYNIKYCNNMMGGQNTEVFNLPITDLAVLARKALGDNQPVWIAADWGKFYSCEYSALDLDLYDYGRLGYYPINKGASLEYQIAKPNHAVLIIGYNLNANGKVDKWLIENSHGDSKCRKRKGHEPEMKGKGYVTMTAEWFNNYVFQVVVEKRYLSYPLRVELNKEARVVEPWGAMGCELLKVS